MADHSSFSYLKCRYSASARLPYFLTRRLLFICLLILVSHVPALGALCFSLPTSRRTVSFPRTSMAICARTTPASKFPAAFPLQPMRKHPLTSPHLQLKHAKTLQVHPGFLPPPGSSSRLAHCDRHPPLWEPDTKESPGCGSPASRPQPIGCCVLYIFPHKYLSHRNVSFLDKKKKKKEET